MTDITKNCVRMGLCAVLAGSGLAVASAAPAQAAVVSTRVTAAAGTVSQSATAMCPAGQFLSGAGGAITGGNGDVTLTDVVPDLAAQTVTVWGHSNPGATPGTYDVVAQAICVPGNTPANYQVVTVTSPLNGDQVKVQPAACPAGTALLGLGARIDGGQGEVFYQDISPNAGLTTATVRAAASGNYPGPWSVTAYAICATPPAAAGSIVISTTGPSTNTGPKAQGSPCPAGARVTGVGGTLSLNTLGNVLLTGIGANAAQDTATATADSDGLFVPGWDLTSHAICYS